MEKSEALLAEVRKETDEQVKKSRVRTNVLENLLRRREKHAASIEKSRMEISRLDKLIAAERKRLEEIKLTQVAQICQKKRVNLDDLIRLISNDTATVDELLSMVDDENVDSTKVD